MPDSNPALLCADLSWGYAQVALGDHVDVTIMPGEMVAIIGPNGAGKSSLLRTWAGMQPRLAGRIELFGQSLDHYSAPTRAARVALLPQTPDIDSELTVRELVELGRTPHLGMFGALTSADKEAIDRAVTLCRLGELLDRRLGHLSGGEQQRARLGMIMAQGSSLVLLDEPGSQLDLHWRHHFFELLHELRRSAALTVIMVLHDLKEAYREANRVLVLADRTIREISADNPQRGEILSRAFAVPETVIF